MEKYCHLRVLVELVEHNLRLRAALELNDDAHAVEVALVAHVADLVNDFFGNKLDALDRPSSSSPDTRSGDQAPVFP